MQSKTFKILLTGRVQGVGFRPFVYNLAKKHQIKGTVSNNELGVVIYINASRLVAKKFYRLIIENKPKASRITDSQIFETSCLRFSSFDIVPSDTKHKTDIPITPDFAICKNCKSEIANPKNRRYQYAFATCVKCGPRYGITNRYPFEREHTTMGGFKMCNACKVEYKTPTDIRFHSQTNSCKKCGIKMFLKDKNAKIIELNQDEIIKKVALLIKSGNIIAIKNTSGYLLCCDATNHKAIKTLRARKLRPRKPFAVLYPSIDYLEKEFELTEQEKEAICSDVGPIVILNNPTKKISLSSAVAPCLNQTGVMLPSSALLQLLMNELQLPLIATSGNNKGSAIISTQEKAQKELREIADYFVCHNLKIQFPQDDSLIRFAQKTQLILRRSRGLAPSYLGLKAESKERVLAMGSHLKNTITIASNQNIYTSQYLGNLSNYNVLKRHKQTVSSYVKLFSVEPKIILTDFHQQYQSTILGEELAEKNNSMIIKVQHHKAHFASVLAENNLFESNEKILGIIWDGAGWGEDNNIWGGEFFIYNNLKIYRENHFEYFDWIANDKMANEPRLSLLSLLKQCDNSILRQKFTTTELRIYNQMLQKNTLKTSSIGRLFDAVASLLNLIDLNTYESEASILLENFASKYKGVDLIDFSSQNNSLSGRKIILNIIKAISEGQSKEKIAKSFIYTLVKIIINYAKKSQIKIVACSGGVFQNAILVSLLLEMTKEANIELKLNLKLSANDENISFGQLMYYQNCKN